MLSMFENFLSLLKTQMEIPKPYGGFHLVWWLIVIAASAYLCIFQRNISSKKMQSIIFYLSIFQIIFQVYVQIYYGLSIKDNKIIFEIPWRFFPWQFCVTPMYAELLSCVVKKGKLHDSLYAFLATYVVSAGLCVMFYPNPIFTESVGVNIETMSRHGIMVILGVWMLASEKVKLEYKTLLKAFPVLMFVIIVAMVMNEAAFFSGILEEQEFNMFYISPYCPPSLVVYSFFQQIIPYPWCVLMYIAIFIVTSFLVLSIAIAIKKLVVKSKGRLISKSI